MLGEVVLRSLQKLEAQLLSQAKHKGTKDDDEWSDIGPLLNTKTSLAQSACFFFLNDMHSKDSKSSLPASYI